MSCNEAGELAFLSLIAMSSIVIIRKSYYGIKYFLWDFLWSHVGIHNQSVIFVIILLWCFKE